MENKKGLVGTSFSKCLRSIFLGEVKVEDVSVIITRTRFEKKLSLAEMTSIESYYRTTNPVWEDLPVSQETTLKLYDIYEQLFRENKISQPRVHGASPYYKVSNSVWL